MQTISSESERTLFRVLQRANLAQYFDLFIAQGGDDVNQLCEAGEEEFLEIMALVGMASKPLHVRRLQKALHEWLTNPDSFMSECPPLVSAAPPKGSILASVPNAAARLSNRYWLHESVSSTRRGTTTGNGSNAAAEMYTPMNAGRNGDESSDRASERISRRQSPCSDQLDTDLPNSSDWPQPCSPSSNMFSAENGVSQLSDAQVQAIELCAAELSSSLPMYAPRPLNMKKNIDREIEEVMNLPDDHKNRIDLLRKYSAIYGRFDSKRRSEKLMNMHELLVNEAAAQLCRYRPTLLTRREDLFPLARQVVRDCGVQYTRSPIRTKESGTASDTTPSKQPKLNSSLSGNDNNLKSLYNGTDPAELDDSINDRSIGSQSPNLDNESNQPNNGDLFVDEPTDRAPESTMNGIKREQTEAE